MANLPKTAKSTKTKDNHYVTPVDQTCMYAHIFTFGHNKISDEITKSAMHRENHPPPKKIW